MHFFKIMTRRIALDICSDPVPRSKRLEENGFTRSRGIGLDDALFFLLCMGGGSMNQGMYDCFKGFGDLPSVPAMIERRGKLKAPGRSS